MRYSTSTKYLTILIFLVSLFSLSLLLWFPLSQRQSIRFASTGNDHGIVEEAQFLTRLANFTLPDHPIDYKSVPPRIPKRPLVTNNSSTLLCVVFAACTPSGLAQFLATTEQVHKDCDWAIVCYRAENVLREIQSGTMSNFRTTVQAAGVKLVFLEYERNRARLLKRAVSIASSAYPLLSPSMSTLGEWLYDAPYNSAVYPKPLLLLQIRSVLIESTYHRVWLLDGDISFEGFDMTQFMQIVDGSFKPSASPLIWQTLVAENTQSCKYLNANTWKFSQSSLDPIVAAGTGFVEIQMPLMDVGFLLWFIDAVVSPLLPAIHILGADWGFDYLFCEAATFYAANYLGWPTYTSQESGSPTWWQRIRLLVVQRRSRGRTDGGKVGQENVRTVSESPVCAVAIGGTPLHHWDTREGEMHQDRLRKKALNLQMMAALRRMFPGLYVPGCSASADPLHLYLNAAVDVTGPVDVGTLRRHRIVLRSELVASTAR